VRVYQFRHIRVGRRRYRRGAPPGGAGRTAPAAQAAPRRRRGLLRGGATGVTVRPLDASRVSFASLGSADFAPLSSRGLGRRPLMAETRVRIPVAVSNAPRVFGAFRVSGGCWVNGWVSACRRVRLATRAANALESDPTRSSRARRTSRATVASCANLWAAACSGLITRLRCIGVRVLFRSIATPRGCGAFRVSGGGSCQDSCQSCDRSVGERHWDVNERAVRARSTMDTLAKKFQEKPLMVTGP
jgi:hypothetical protein